MFNNSKKISKKLITLILAVVLLCAAVPVYAAVSDSTKTVTVDATKIATGSERFAAYLFDGSDSSVFVNMKANGKTYTADVPTSYNKIIFCRMTGGSETNSWNNCWNQTYDLNLSDGNVYTLTGWGSGNKMNGYWSNSQTTTAPSTTEATTTTTVAPTTQDISNNGTFLVGTFNNWKIGQNPITTTYRGGSSEIHLDKGSYEFKFVSVSGNNSNWVGADNAVINNVTENAIKVKTPGNNIKLNITVAGTYSFYFRMDTGTISVSRTNTDETTTTTVAPTTTTIATTTTTVAPTTQDVSNNGTFLVGTFNNWKVGQNPITTTYRGGSSEIHLDKGSYEFKFVSVSGNNTNWVGADNAVINNVTENAIKVKTPGDNIKLNITVAGTYSFYFRMDTGTISVSRTKTDETVAPTTQDISNNGTFLVGTFNNWKIGQNPITTTYRGGEASVYLSKGSYEFKFVRVSGNNSYWVGADNAVINNVTENPIKVKTPGNNIKLNITEAGNYTFYFRMDTGTISVWKA